MTYEQLMALAAPKLHEKRVQAVSIPLSNTTFYATTDESHNIVGHFVTTVTDPGYNHCVMLGYSHVAAI